MLRCRLERRARFFFAEVKKNSPHCPQFSVLLTPNKLIPSPSKIISLITIIAFHVVFVLPLSMLGELSAQSVPVLGSTKQFANDELKPYVDAAKASAMDSAT
ncbi:hypothetical protein, partial [Leptospira noguchii]